MSQWLHRDCRRRTPPATPRRAGREARAGPRSAEQGSLHTRADPRWPGRGSTCLRPRPARARGGRRAGWPVPLRPRGPSRGRDGHRSRKAGVGARGGEALLRSPAHASSRPFRAWCRSFGRSRRSRCLARVPLSRREASRRSAAPEVGARAAHPETGQELPDPRVSEAYGFLVSDVREARERESGFRSARARRLHRASPGGNPGADHRARRQDLDGERVSASRSLRRRDEHRPGVSCAHRATVSRVATTTPPTPSSGTTGARPSSMAAAPS